MSNTPEDIGNGIISLLQELDYSTAFISESPYAHDLGSSGIVCKEVNVHVEGIQILFKVSKAAGSQSVSSVHVVGVRAHKCNVPVPVDVFDRICSDIMRNESQLALSELRALKSGQDLAKMERKNSSSLWI